VFQLLNYVGCWNFENLGLQNPQRKKSHVERYAEGYPFDRWLGMILLYTGADCNSASTACLMLKVSARMTSKWQDILWLAVFKKQVSCGPN
jgi:hypothetical protein